MAGLVAIYLAAVVGANLSVAWLGPVATVPNAFLLIGLVITTRDRLHEAWGAQLKSRMGLLIAAGGVLSWLANAGAGRIALASTVAFAVSETVDALVYQRLRRAGWYAKTNGSNVASSVLDSVLFPTIAFGAFLPWIVLGQIAAKIAGGFVWSVGLRPSRRIAGIIILAMLALPRGAGAQILSAGVGTVTTPFGTRNVLEVYAGGPLYALGFRPYAIASWPDLDLTERPTLIVAADRQYLDAFSTAGWGISAAIGPGVLMLPFTDYRPEFQLSNTVLAFTPLPRWKLVAIGSWQPFDRDDWAVVVKADLALLYNP